MSNTYARVLTGALAATAASVGVWATIWPRSFYTTFPGLGQAWVAPLGPYNEHLVRDVGALYLALLVVSAWAAWRDDPASFRAVGVAWLVFGVPHLVFHALNRDGLSDAEWLTSLTALATTALAAGLLVVVRSRRLAPTSTRRTRAEVAR